MELQHDYSFSKLYSIDVSAHVEKKGQFNYLSWPYAVKVLRENDPTATWRVIRFNDQPFMKTECGYFVEVEVTMHGIALSQIHPVLDGANRPIQQPNAFHINTSIQRCLVKAIALHGLGLYIYAGEDLPNEEAAPPPTQTAQKAPQSAPQPTTHQLQPQAQQSRSNVPHSFKSEAFRLRIEHHMEWNELQSVAERVLGRKLKKVTELQDDKEWELIVNELKSFNLDPALPF
jgi:hypothetical protein